MWTVENRTLYERKGGRYPSDLTDAEWALIGPMIPPAKHGGRQRTVDLRKVASPLWRSIREPKLRSNPCNLGTIWVPCRNNGLAVSS
jgi:transposase